MTDAQNCARNVRDAWTTALTRTLAVAITLIMLVSGTTAAQAATPPPGLGGFKPGNIILDSEMFAGNRLTETQISDVLRRLGASCDSTRTAAPCLKDLRVSSPSRPATKYCAAVTARTDAPIARIIRDVSVACNVNPQVLIVKLQKEQGLVTTTAPTWERYDKALGFRCPDFQACDPAYRGIVHQLYFASSRLQEYGDPALGFTFHVGTYLVSYSPDASCGKAVVQIANRATAALYNYTPFTPSQASLDAGAAAVPNDPCAAYGNRNFFRYYSLWFGTPNGTDGTAYPVAAPPETVDSPFTDVIYGVTPFFADISWMKTRGITGGYADGTYRPFRTISRGEISAFLYRLEGSPSYTPPATSPFTDIAPGDGFYRQITWLSSTGVTGGYQDGTFRPGESIERGQVAAFLRRFDRL